MRLPQNPPPAPMSTMSKRDYYEVLGVERDASTEQIAVAYRKLAIKFHPDSNPGDADATERFKEAAEAYEVLNDQEKRARYDQYGHAGVEGAGSQFHQVEDIFEAFGDLFGGGLFGDLFGGGRRRRVRRGADVRAELHLTLEEAARGVRKEVVVNRSKQCKTCSGSGARPGSQPKTCPRCNGQGKFVQAAGILRVQTDCPTCGGAGTTIEDPCRECRGHGRVADRVTLEISVPAGVDDGMRVRLNGEGEPSPDGGPAGDCYCFVSVEEHPLFQREGSHLILSMPITYSQAALGTALEVPTLDGPHELDVPAGTQSGDVFRLRGMGVPDPQTRRPGDLLVRTHIETPKKISKQQRALLEQLAEMENVDVTPQRKSFLERLREHFAGD